MKPPNGKAIDKKVIKYKISLPNKELFFTLNLSWF